VTYLIGHVIGIGVRHPILGAAGGPAQEVADHLLAHAQALAVDEHLPELLQQEAVDLVHELLEREGRALGEAARALTEATVSIIWLSAPS
jgi:hypothetical protein